MGTFDAFKDLFQEKEDNLTQTQGLNNQLGLEISHLSNEKKYLNEQLTRIREQYNTLEELEQEALVLFPTVDRIDYGLTPMSDSLNTWMTTVMVNFNDKTRPSQQRTDFERIDQWLQTRYQKFDSLRIMQVK